MCAQLLSARSWRLRKVIDSDGSVKGLLIRRLACTSCKRIHHELPDCIVPYKRHCAQTIEQIVNGKTEGTPCESGSIRRIQAWWQIMLPYFLNILKSLAEKVQMPFHNPPAFKQLMRAAANANEWAFPNTVCTRSGCVP